MFKWTAYFSKVCCPFSVVSFCCYFAQWILKMAFYNESAIQCSHFATNINSYQVHTKEIMHLMIDQDKFILSYMSLKCNNICTLKEVNLHCESWIIHSHSGPNGTLVHAFQYSRRRVVVTLNMELLILVFPVFSYRIRTIYNIFPSVLTVSNPHSHIDKMTFPHNRDLLSKDLWKEELIVRFSW